MIVNGIIAEYNPFHNGHAHHLAASRAETGADYSIVVLGSNFTQRGEPALLDKFVRAKMALENGADLVIELPISHSCASAEYFARGGVSILDQLGLVDYLCFGSECGDAAILQKFADVLMLEPETYVADLKSGLAAGHSYPAARNRAILHCAPELAAYEDVLSSPNNILGIEYLKALKLYQSPIKPFSIPRAGAGYHDRMRDKEYVSAMAIREALMEAFTGNDGVPQAAGNAAAPQGTGKYGEDGAQEGYLNALASLKGQMPETAYEILLQSLKETPPITTGDFSHMLLYKLLMEGPEGYHRFFDVSSDLSDRIYNSLKQYEGYEAFCDLLKSKNMTYARISRCLLHVLLDLKKEDLLAYGEMGRIPYARVLGFRKDAAPLLAKLKETSRIPLVTKLSAAADELSPAAYSLLTQDLRRGSIYESIAALKSGRRARDEREIPMVII